MTPTPPIAAAAAQPDALQDFEIRKLAAIPAVDEGRLVERRPVAYRRELEDQFVRGFRAAESRLHAQVAALTAAQPDTLAYAVQALIDGKWCIQWPVASSQREAERDMLMYTKEDQKRMRIIPLVQSVASQEAAERAVPAGWVPIPVEPTEEMMVAGWAEGWSALENYRSLLAASPAQPAPEPAPAPAIPGQEAWRVFCPFCGGGHTGRTIHKGSQVIECQECLARGPQADDADAAKLAWATRAPQPAPAPSLIDAEAKSYNDWFNGEQGTAYDGMWAFGRAAWMERASADWAQPAPAQDGLPALFREALAWGMTYGPEIPAHQWDEMRESMVKQYADRAARAPVVAAGGVRQAISDRFGFLEGLVNEHTFTRIVETAAQIAAAPQPPAPAAGSEQKALAALRYYMTECSGAEPSISVFHRMVDEALEAAPSATAIAEAIEALRPISHNSTDDPRGQAVKAIALLASINTAPAATADALTLLAQARAALWQPSNIELCERIDAAMAAQRGGA